jgi:NAD(P)-dependent dehydrogenase (short-subunit alcohol dehydrogenase family)
MKIILVGANGTIGQAITKSLSGLNAEIIAVGQNSGELQVNITSEESIKALFEKVGTFDGLISAAGSGYYGPLEKMSAGEAIKGLGNKLMGQVNLVLIGKDYINAGGFFTLTSGNLAEEGNVNSANLGMINGALNGFVVNAALEMPNNIRLNVVSPSVLTESVAKYGEPENRESIPGEEVGAAYKQTVTEKINGQVLKAYGKLKTV